MQNHHVDIEAFETLPSFKISRESAVRAEGVLYISRYTTDQINKRGPETQEEPCHAYKWDRREREREAAVSQRSTSSVVHVNAC